MVCEYKGHLFVFEDREEELGENISYSSNRVFLKIMIKSGGTRSFVTSPCTLAPYPSRTHKTTFRPDIPSTSRLCSVMCSVAIDRTSRLCNLDALLDAIDHLLVAAKAIVLP
jgi:hypothetical protein